MKQLLLSFLLLFSFCNTHAQINSSKSDTAKPRLYIDIHHLPAGTVKFNDVADAHAKDLAVQNKHNVQFLKYWVDEKQGLVYCLSSASDSAHIADTHREAHGLLPQEVYKVTDGLAAMPKDGKTYFLDVHKLGAGNVTADAVAKAHDKDLAVQKKHEVNFINYWVDEQKGVVYCLSQAKKAKDVVKTHKEAHGLVPTSIEPIKQGQ